MSVRRFGRLDAVAIGFLVVGVLLALAVCTYDPANPADANPPTHPAANNVVRLPGTWVGAVLVENLGAAAYVLLAGWFALSLMLLLRCGWARWVLRLVGWLLLTPFAAVLADRWGGAWPGGPVTGGGGGLGAWLSLQLAAHFDLRTQVAVIGGGLAIGVLLAGDVIAARLPRLVLWAWRWVWDAGLPTDAAPAKRPRARPPVPKPVDALAVAEADPADKPPVASQGIPIFHHDEVAAAEDSSGRAAAFALSDQERYADYKLPPLALLEDAKPLDLGNQDQVLRERAALLEKTFLDFGLNVRVVGINTGPVVTQFEIALETGMRMHKVTRLADDVGLNLKAASVRMVAPIPGKNTVGVEIPNENRADVRLKEVILASGKKIAKSKIPLFLGKDAEGRPLVHDLAEMPHLLIAGRTGTGKSVCLNVLILSILMTRRPDEVKLILIDPKVVEFGQFAKIPHLMHPVVSDMKKAEAILAWAVDKMEERYDLLSRARVRNIAAYNDLKLEEIWRRLAPADQEERDRIPKRLPSIVIIVDEMGDLIMQMRKEVEGHIIRLTQKSRAAGIHLILATQRPTVDIITGLIKSNLPARICFRVTSKTDSRVVLDEMGADKLLGRGDMLLLPPGGGELVRAQGAYASDEEIQKVVDRLECDPCYEQELMLLDATDKAEGGAGLEKLRDRDELYEAAIDVVVREQRGSVSLLQRVLGIGYGRAARLIDFMAEDRIVGEYNGSNAREVLYTPETWAVARGGVRKE